MTDKGLGRLVAPDERDGNFPMQSVLPAQPRRDRRYWNAQGWWGDQGPDPHCVAFAWTHWLEDGPVTHKGPAPIVTPSTLYHDAQKVDEWEGESYDGTSVRAGAKVLQSWNMIGEYRWAFDIDTLTVALLEAGPIVVGTNWYASMSEPGGKGLVRELSGGIQGGHAYLLDGININRGLIRAKNSWGRSWGHNGFFYLSIAHVERLINEDGEACLAIERGEGDGND